jgi:DNA polymerase
LREPLAAFELCALRDTATNLVFAEGDPASTTLIIGEPPGREEDRSGRPFAGAEGELLDQMLASVGLERDRLMLTPLLPWRPPGGRPPSASEVALCLPFLHRLIVLLGPRRLLLFGASAARAMLAPGLTRRRQTPGWHDSRISGLPEPLPALTVPSLTEMRNTLSLRRTAWAGMRLLRRAVDSENNR